jgi:hypothetical protein
MARALPRSLIESHPHKYIYVIYAISPGPKCDTCLVCDFEVRLFQTPRPSSGRRVVDPHIRRHASWVASIKCHASTAISALALVLNTGDCGVDIADLSSH